MTSAVGIGIDVAKAKVDVASTDGSLVLTVERTAEGLAGLVEQLADFDVHRVVLEASGGYERAVLDVLCAADLPVVLVQPKRARAVANALGRRAKTDAIDAAVLAWMALHAVDSDPLYSPLPETMERLRELVFRRKQLVESIGADTKRKRRARTEAAIESFERTLAFLKAEKKAIEKGINATIAELDHLAGAVEALESVKGVGRVTAATLLVTVPELGRIGRKPVSALVGVAPWNRDSGTKSGHRYIHGGRSAARCSLYMAALSAIRHGSPPLRTLYERLRAKGKPAKVAIVACMRKLLIHLNSTMRSYLSRPTAPAIVAT